MAHSEEVKEPMADRPRSILICSCEDTMPLDGEAVSRVCRDTVVVEGRQLCRAELDRFRKVAGTGAPVVVADLPAPDSKRTIAFYAHYDGQPVDPGRWKSDPWKPVMRDQVGNDVDWRNAKAIDPEWRAAAC